MVKKIKGKLYLYLYIFTKMIDITLDIKDKSIKFNPRKGHSYVINDNAW